MKKELLYLLLTLSLSWIQAQTLDNSFNLNLRGRADVQQIEPLPNGKILVHGSFTHVSGQKIADANTSVLIKLNADGSPDTDFNILVFQDSLIREVKYLSSEKILVSGTSSDGDFLFRINSDGTDDDTFNVSPELLSTVNYYPVLEEAASGILVVANSQVMILDQLGNVLQSAPLSFTGLFERVFGIANTADEKIILFGDYELEGTSYRGIVRLNSDLSIDESFDTSSSIEEATITHVEVQDDGKLLLSNNIQVPGESNFRNLMRLNIDGSIDESFASVSNFATRKSLQQANGDILIMGTQSTRLLNSSGVVEDFLFRADAAGRLNDVQMLPDGSVLTGGTFAELDFSNADNTLLTQSGISKSDANYDAFTGFDANLAGTGFVSQVVLQEDGKLLISGDFSSVNGIDHRFFSRVNSDASVDESFLNEFQGLAHAIFPLSSGKILVSQVSDNDVLLLNADGSIDETFSLNTRSQFANEGVNEFMEQPDGSIIMGGDFIEVNETAISNLARIGPDGTLDNSFNSANAIPFGVRDIQKLQNSDEYYIAGFNINGFGSMLKVDENGDVVSNFTLGLADAPQFRQLKLQSDGKIVFAGTTRGDTKFGRLLTDGSLDESFINSSFDADDLEVILEDKILLGGSDGNIDSSLVITNDYGNFSPVYQTYVDGQISDLLVDGNTVYVAGRFFSIGEKEINGIAKVSIEGIEANLAPEVENFTFSILETIADEVVGIASALDPDGDTLTYILTQGNEEGLFEIDNEGILSLSSDEIAVDSDTQFNLTATASDRSFTSEYTITVNVENVLSTGNELTQAIYPNPSSSVLTIAGKKIRAAGIYTVEGVLVKAGTAIEEDSITLNISQLKNGLYIVRIESVDGDVSTRRLIKN